MEDKISNLLDKTRYEVFQATNTFINVNDKKIQKSLIIDPCQYNGLQLEHILNNSYIQNNYIYFKETCKIPNFKITEHISFDISSRNTTYVHRSDLDNTHTLHPEWIDEYIRYIAEDIQFIENNKINNTEFSSELLDYETRVLRPDVLYTKYKDYIIVGAPSNRFYTNHYKFNNPSIINKHVLGDDVPIKWRPSSRLFKHNQDIQEPGILTKLEEIGYTENIKIDNNIRNNSTLFNTEYKFHIYKKQDEIYKLEPEFITDLNNTHKELLEFVFDTILKFMSKQCGCLKEQIYVCANISKRFYLTAIYSHSYNYYEYYAKQMYRLIDLIYIIDTLDTPGYWTQINHSTLIRTVKKREIHGDDANLDLLINGIQTAGSGRNKINKGMPNLFSDMAKQYLISRGIDTTLINSNIKVVLCKKYINAEYILLCKDNTRYFILYISTNIENSLNQITDRIKLGYDNNNNNNIIINRYRDEKNKYEFLDIPHLLIKSCFKVTEQLLQLNEKINIYNTQKNSKEMILINELITEKDSLYTYPLITRNTVPRSIIDNENIKVTIDNYTYEGINPLKFNTKFLIIQSILVTYLKPNIIYTLDNYRYNIPPNLLQFIDHNNYKSLFPCIINKTDTYYVLTCSKRRTLNTVENFHYVHWILPISDKYTDVFKEIGTNIYEHTNLIKLFPNYISGFYECYKLNKKNYDDITYAITRNTIVLCGQYRPDLLVDIICSSIALNFNNDILDIINSIDPTYIPYILKEYNEIIEKYKNNFIQRYFNNYVHTSYVSEFYTLHIHTQVLSLYDKWNMHETGLKRLSSVFKWSNIGDIIRIEPNLFKKFRYYKCSLSSRIVELLLKYIDTTQKQSGGYNTVTYRSCLSSVTKNKKLFLPDTYYYIYKILHLLTLKPLNYNIQHKNKYIDTLLESYSKIFLDFYKDNKFTPYVSINIDSNLSNFLILGTFAWIERHVFDKYTDNTIIIEDYPFFNYNGLTEYKPFKNRKSITNIELYNTFDCVYVPNPTGLVIYRLILFFRSIFLQFIYTVIADSLLFLKQNGTLILRVPFFEQNDAFISIFAILISLFNNYSFTITENHYILIYFYKYNRPDYKTLTDLTNKMKQLNIDNPLPPIDKIFENLAYNKHSPWIYNVINTSYSPAPRLNKKDIIDIKYYTQTFIINDLELLKKAKDLVFELDKHKQNYVNQIEFYGQLIESKKLDNALLFQQLKNKFVLTMKTLIIYANKHNISYNPYYKSFFTNYVNKFIEKQSFRHKYYPILKLDEGLNYIDLDIEKFDLYFKNINIYKEKLSMVPDKQKKIILDRFINNSKLLLRKSLQTKFNLNKEIPYEFIVLYEVIIDTNIYNSDDKVKCNRINDNISNKVVSYCFKNVADKINLIIFNNSNLTDLDFSKLDTGSCIIHFDLSLVTVNVLLETTNMLFNLFDEIVFSKPFSSYLESLDIFIVCKNINKKNKKSKYTESFIYQMLNFIYNFTNEYIDIVELVLFINECQNPNNRYTDDLTACNLFLLSGHNNKNYTYIVHGNNKLNYDELHKLLQSKGFIQVSYPTNLKYIDFIYLEQNEMKNKDFFSINSRLKNMLPNQKLLISDKEKLYYSLLKKYPEIAIKHMPYTRNINDITDMKNGEILIIRPVGPGAHTGKGIEVVTNIDDLLKVKKDLTSFKSTIASTYIPNPALWNSRKFHIRRNWLVSTNKIHSLHKEGRIYTAKKEYIYSDFTNKDIHDSHMKSTPTDLYYPEDLPKTINYNNVEKQMKDILFYVYKVLEPYIKSYQESKYSYEVFGVDFMIDTNHNVFLIEINSPATFKTIFYPEMSPRYTKFCKKYFEWLYNTIIKKILS